jgi:hypothetical protein
MSQSDYIKRKRVATELKAQTKLQPVIESGQYVDFKEFTLQNTIYSNKLQYQKILPLNGINVFGIQLATTQNCPTFIICEGTNSRVNRRPLLGVQSASTSLRLKPKHATINNLSLCKACDLR